MCKVSYLNVVIILSMRVQDYLGCFLSMHILDHSEPCKAPLILHLYVYPKKSTRMAGSIFTTLKNSMKNYWVTYNSV
jgi:hypothetical protein